MMTFRFLHHRPYPHATRTLPARRTHVHVGCACGIHARSVLYLNLHPDEEGNREHAKSWVNESDGENHPQMRMIF